MLKYQTFVSLKRMLRVENAKHFLQVPKKNVQIHLLQAITKTLRL